MDRANHVPNGSYCCLHEIFQSTKTTSPEQPSAAEEKQPQHTLRLFDGRLKVILQVHKDTPHLRGLPATAY